MGKVFSPEFMLGGNKTVLEKPMSNRPPGWDKVDDKKEIKDNEIDIDAYKVKKSTEKSGVNRLLKHLKKARLAKSQYEEV